MNITRKSNQDVFVQGSLYLAGILNFCNKIAGKNNFCKEKTASPLSLLDLFPGCIDIKYLFVLNHINASVSEP